MVIIPFSQLISPSVTDSAKAGATTVLISLSENESKGWIKRGTSVVDNGKRDEEGKLY